MNKNFKEILKQAKKMQSEMVKIQEELEEKTVEASSGGGMVTVVANGRKNIVSIKIEPEIVASNDIEMLQDLIVSAVNAALSKVDELTMSEVSKVTGGLNLQGLF